ncbi:MAG: serine/threonine protein kinase [Gemmataceae bacterium]|nr:serine/threonine protein kinase [Gemmataceae bacterium]
MLRAFTILIGCTLLVFLSHTQLPTSAQPAAEDADWPLFRGDPLQTGVAKGKLPEKLEIRWKIDLKKGIESTAAIVKGTVYVGCYDDHLHAYDLKTGQLKWKTKLGPIKAPPSVYQDKVFVGDEDGMFYCVDAITGKKIWDFETAGEITGGANFDGDKVLFGSHDSTLYCLSIKSKELLWKVKTEGPVNGSAVVAKGQTFVAGCDSHLHIIELAKGTTLAKIELSGQAAATAAVFGDKLYVGNMNSEMQGIDLKKKDVQWSYAPNRAQPFYSSAAVTDKLVVAGSRDRHVHAVHRATGEVAWTFTAKGRVDSSPVIVGKRVYFGSTDGTLHVLDLDKGMQVQSLELGQGITASAAVAHGCLVIGTTDGLLYCLGTKN